MLIRSEPFREFDRITEAMLSERRARQIPVDAYRRGDEFTVRVRPSRRRCPLHRPDRREGSAHRTGDTRLGPR